jgi:hypothetical protein
MKNIPWVSILSSPTISPWRKSRYKILLFFLTTVRPNYDSFQFGNTGERDN